MPTRGPTLKHQRNLLAAGRDFDGLGSWYARGEKTGAAATRFRKGACENCGAATHDRKGCLERPRRRGAKWSGVDIQADEVVSKVNLNWEGKRDGWNGFQAADYGKVQKRYEVLEGERERLRAERMEKEAREGGRKKEDDDDDDDDDADKGEGGEVVMQEKSENTPAVVRNLRIREDTAKYLRNLDENSAYYDPKTRSMRADPNPDVGADDKDFAGDNFVRYTGDVKELARMELHAVKAATDGRSLPHLLAEPTMAEQVYKDFSSRKGAIEDRRRAEIIERYGGEEHFGRDPSATGVQESEAYVEYDRDGQVLSGKEAARPVSKYAEDVLEGNHKAVLGSFYEGGRWGYDCCGQTTRNAYCTGEAGKKAATELADEMASKTDAVLKKRGVTFAVPDASKSGPVSDGDRPKRSRSDAAEDDDDSKRKKIETALQAQAKDDAAFEADDRRRAYNSSGGYKEVTDEDMEAYKLRRHDADDPMANFLGEGSSKRK